MKTNKLIIMWLILLTAVSCVKRYGCTQEKAVNYDPEAKLENYHCYFNETLRFSMKSSTNSIWNDEGINSLKFYVDTNQVYTADVDTLITEINVPIVMHDKPQSFHLLIVANTGDTIRYQRFATPYNSEVMDFNLW